MNFEIEELSLSAWPALQTIVYDGWILRFAEGYTKRSNSVNPLYPSTLPLGEKIETCEARYRSLELPTIFKITEAESQRPIDDALARVGYEKIDETVVMTRQLASADAVSAALSPNAADSSSAAASPAATNAAALSLASAFDDQWIEAFCACGKHQGELSVIGRILVNVIVPIVVASATEKGMTVGCGYGAIDSGWVGLYDIVVDEKNRRRGHGEAIVAAILERSAELGASRAYLQVVAANAPARKLYSKLGFRDSYRYWYRRRR